MGVHVKSRIGKSFDGIQVAPKIRCKTFDEKLWCRPFQHFYGLSKMIRTTVSQVCHKRLDDATNAEKVLDCPASLQIYLMRCTHYFRPLVQTLGCGTTAASTNFAPYPSKGVGYHPPLRCHPLNEFAARLNVEHFAFSNYPVNFSLHSVRICCLLEAT